MDTFEWRKFYQVSAMVTVFCSGLQVYKCWREMGENKEIKCMWNKENNNKFATFNKQKQKPTTPGSRGGAESAAAPFFSADFLGFWPIFVIFWRGIEEFGFLAPPFHRSWIRLCLMSKFCHCCTSHDIIDSFCQNKTSAKYGHVYQRLNNVFSSDE